MSVVNKHFAEAILKSKNVCSAANMRPSRSGSCGNQYRGGTGPIFETGLFIKLSSRSIYLRWLSFSRGAKIGS